MGVESLGAGVGAAVGEVVSSGLSSTASGVGVGLGAIGNLSGGIEGGVSPGLSAGLGAPFGGPDLLGGRTGSLADFQLAFNFGSEHSVSGEIYPGKALIQPTAVFDEGLFGVFAQPSKSITPESQPSPTFFEMFGPRLGPVAPPVNEGPVKSVESVFEGSIFETLPIFQPAKPPEFIADLQSFVTGEAVIRKEPPEKTSQDIKQLINEDVASAVSVSQETPAISATSDNLVENAELTVINKVKREKKTAKGTRLTVALLPQEKTVWQILTGDLIFESKREKKVLPGEARQVLIQPKVVQVEPGEISDKEVEEPVVQTQAGVEDEVSVEKEAKSVVQTVTDGKIGGGGIVETLQDEDQPEEPVEMKEPIWEMSRKKPDEEEVAKSVLKRRVGVAREIAGQGLLPKITSQLVRLDIPIPREFLRIILGQLTFPLVARKAEREVKRLNAESLNPTKIWKTLESLLENRPPLQSRAGGMEHIGSLPQSELATIDTEIARLAYQKKKEHIGLTWRGIWKGFGKKPSKYPWEFDKTKITRPIDRQVLGCYTLFAKRAVARAKRKEAKSQ